MLRYTLPTLRPCYDTAWNRYGIEAKGEPKDHLRRTKGGFVFIAFTSSRVHWRLLRDIWLPPSSSPSWAEHCWYTIWKPWLGQHHSVLLTTCWCAGTLHETLGSLAVPPFSASTTFSRFKSLPSMLYIYIILGTKITIFRQKSLCFAINMSIEAKIFVF